MNWTQHKGGSSSGYELIYSSSNTSRNFATQMAAGTDWDGSSEAVFNVIINSGVVLSAGTTTGSFPGSSLVTCINNGTIRGTNCSGDDGLDLQHNLTLDNTNGTISGGGGSAGNAGSGGTRGNNSYWDGESCAHAPGSAGNPGSPGSCGAYGSAGNAGNSGNPGSGGGAGPMCGPGSPGNPGNAGNAGGAAGYAIRLNGNTRTNAGTGTINGTVG
jgi:hypothetical protein